MTRPTAVHHVRMLVAGVLLVLASIALGFGIAAQGGGPIATDAGWMSFIASTRSPIADGFAYALNWLGGGWFAVYAIPLGAAAVFLVLRRPASAAVFLLASALSAGGVQVLKNLFGRDRPLDMIVDSDFGSFPSGHVANATTIAVVLVLLVPRLWVLIAGAAWVLAMGWSRTYLGAHWTTDLLGGVLIGAGAAILVYLLVSAVVDRVAARTSDTHP